MGLIWWCSRTDRSKDEMNESMFSFNLFLGLTYRIWCIERELWTSNIAHQQVFAQIRKTVGGCLLWKRLSETISLHRLLGVRDIFPKQSTVLKKWWQMSIEDDHYQEQVDLYVANYNHKVPYYAWSAISPACSFSQLGWRESNNIHSKVFCHLGPMSKRHKCQLFLFT